MTLVVADTGPIHCLHLVGRIELLRDLYSVVTIPPAVLREMSHPKAPPGLQAIANSPPACLQIRTPEHVYFRHLLEDGEAETISLAMEWNARLILIDQRDGRRSAALGFQISGTLGILEEAAERRLINLEEVLDDLRKTRFLAEASLYEAVLKRDRDRRTRQR